MKQRGITQQEVEFILKYPKYVKNSFEQRKEAIGEINNRVIRIKFIETENYKRIITVF